MLDCEACELVVCTLERLGLRPSAVDLGTSELGGGRVKAGRAPAAGRREEKLLTSIADPMYEVIYVVEQRLDSQLSF